MAPNHDWDEQIFEIMDNFNFSRVAKTMEALDWSWGPLPDNIPTEPDIRAKARKMLLESVAEGRGQSTAGFEVQIDPAEKWLSLAFIVDVWDVKAREKE